MQTGFEGVKIMTLTDIPVSENIKEEFRQGLHKGSIPHANLLIGVPGNSQLALALVVSKSLLCARPRDGVSCNECPSCKKAEKLSHPDLNFSFPLSSTKEDGESAIDLWRSMVLENPFCDLSDWVMKINAENSVLNIHARECNRIERVLGLKSFEGRGKVMIVWLPEFLGKEGNKLLKTIEEPPEGTYLFLVSSREAGILPTIVSRCRVFRIPIMNVQKLGDWLVETRDVSKEEAFNAAAVSEGVVNKALSVLGDQELNIDEEFLNWLRCAFRNNPLETIEYMEEFIQTGGKEKLRNLFRFGLFFFNMVIKKKYGVTVEGLNREVEKSVEKLAQMLSLEDVENVIHALEKFLIHIDRFANAKILLTQASIQTGRILRGSVAAQGERA